MASKDAPQHSRDRRRALIAGILCLIAAGASIADYAEWSINRDRLLAILDAAGLNDDSVLARIQRESTIHHARLDTARALLYEQLRVPALERLPAAERQAALAERRKQLRTAHELARSALRMQPNDWEAAMLQGATTYLTWSLERDRRLVTAADAWQEPLIKAWREAPGRNEPRRFLCTAYLELWPALSAEKKRFATQLLEATFADDADTFQRLGPVWLDTLDDTEQALKIIPDTPRAWELVARYFAERARWSRFSEAHQRGLESLERQLEARLEEGRLRLTLGDEYHSRTRFARVIAESPPDLRFVSYVDRALSLYPAGLKTAGTGDSMRRWLEFAVELAGVGIRALEPSSVGRLAGVVEGMAPHDAALAALASGDSNLAERLERLERSHTSARWTPYLIAKARWLLDHGDAAEAAATLDRIGTLRPREAVYWAARRDVAHALDDRAARLEAELWLERIAAQVWRREAWTAAEGRRGHARQLIMLTARDAQALRIEIAAVPRRGGVVRIRLDGATLSVAPISPRTRSLLVDAALPRGLHLLDWTVLAGGEILPGSVRLP